VSERESWVSYSELGTHRTCPQRWQYAYHRGLEKIDPDDVRVELDFGIWWQALNGAHALERGRKFGSLKYVPKKIKTVDGGPRWPGESVTADQVLADSIVWWQQQTPFIQETWEARLGEGLPVRLGSLFQRWQDQWAEEIANERPLAVEFFWKRPLPSLRPGDEPAADLLGYVDEIYLDTRRNLVAVRDNKTSKALSTQTSVDDMLDSQLQFYAWGASPEVTSWGLGKIQATAYDRARSMAPKPPNLTTAGKLSTREGQPSIGQCDLQTYVEWARGPDGRGVPYLGRKPAGGEASIAGYYQPEQTVIEKLASPAAQSVWFQRTLTPLNSNLIRVHLRAAVDSAVDLQLTRTRAMQTNEAARNLGAACRWCDFQQLCRAEMVGGADGEYELADMKLRKRPDSR